MKLVLLDFGGLSVIAGNKEWKKSTENESENRSGDGGECPP